MGSSLLRTTTVSRLSRRMTRRNGLTLFEEKLESKQTRRRHSLRTATTATTPASLERRDVRLWIAPANALTTIDAPAHRNSFARLLLLVVQEGSHISRITPGMKSHAAPTFQIHLPHLLRSSLPPWPPFRGIDGHRQTARRAKPAIKAQPPSLIPNEFSTTAIYSA